MKKKLHFDRPPPPLFFFSQFFFTFSFFSLPFFSAFISPWRSERTSECPSAGRAAARKRTYSAGREKRKAARARFRCGGGRPPLPPAKAHRASAFRSPPVASHQSPCLGTRKARLCVPSAGRWNDVAGMEAPGAGGRGRWPLLVDGSSACSLGKRIARLPFFASLSCLSLLSPSSLRGPRCSLLSAPLPRSTPATFSLSRP